MKKAFAMKWAKALESGKYKQTKRCLYNGKGYCCLGVAAKLLGEEFIDDGSNSYFLREGNFWNLPERVVEKIGLHNANGMFFERVKGIRHRSLTDLNDHTRMGFKGIAKFIRENWKIL